MYTWMPWGALVVTDGVVQYRNASAGHVPIDLPTTALDPLEWAIVKDGAHEFWFWIGANGDSSGSDTGSDSAKNPGNSTTSSPLMLS